ncbi:MAG: hypothetical protein JWP02_2143 [Acidimicrobiales bacterium]|nr:hypothetical protein [Acidimicrobiales bacterium]
MTPGETRIFGRALGTVGRLQSELDEERRTWLRDVPVRRAIEEFDAYPETVDFDFVSADVEALDAEIHLLGGHEWARAYWRLVMLHFVIRGLQEPRTFVLPPPVHELLVADLGRIVDNAIDGTGPEDPLADDDFILDLAIGRGAAIPMDQFFSVPISIQEASGGFTPGTWMNVHLRGDDFTRETLDAMTPLNFAFFLANPEVQGWFGVGWMLDPELADVSPHLAWYRELMLQAGAHISPAGTDDTTVALATAASATRRTLFDQGRYQPRDWRVIMPREQGLLWYETTGTPRPPDL